MPDSSSKSAEALCSVLSSFRASDVPSGDGIGGGVAGTTGGVVELDSNTSAIDAAKTLWSHNILGAPVWDEAKSRYVGFFDMRDILSAVLACAESMKPGDGGEGALFSKYNTRMVTELNSLGGGEEGAGGEVLRASYLAARNPFASAAPNDTLETLCRILVGSKCHRVPIVDGSAGNRCISIVSQSALVKFLSAHVSKEDLQETIVDAGLPYKKDVVSVADETSATEAFRLLDSHRLSGIAVVDEHGKLVGNTSARDIKLAALDEGRTSMIDTDILSYLASVRQATPAKKERYPSCHVHETSTVAHVVHLLAKTGYHRVFVVDEDIKPVGVISVADILRFALEGGRGD